MLAAVKQITYFYSWTTILDFKLLGYTESLSERIRGEGKLGLRTKAEEAITGLERLRR